MPTLRQRSRDTTTRTRPSDRTLPASHPPREWARIAETAWLDAQVAAFEIEDIERDLAANAERQERGQAWLAEHGPEHPQHARGQQLLRELESFFTRLVIALDVQLMRCWTSCRDLYTATQYGPEALAWMAAEAPLVDVSSPFGIWRALMGERQAPGGWPPEDREHWIVRPGRIEIWQLEELRERVAARQANGAA